MVSTAKKLLLPVVLAAALGLCACGGPTYRTVDSDEAIANWHQARYLQAQGRYGLAREYYLLALSAARTDDVRHALNQELHSVELQIKTLR
jgi:hypothetical protein